MRTGKFVLCKASVYFIADYLEILRSQGDLLVGLSVLPTIRRLLVVVGKRMTKRLALAGGIDGAIVLSRNQGARIAPISLPQRRVAGELADRLGEGFSVVGGHQ
jgi:hypothetical protein